MNLSASLLEGRDPSASLVLGVKGECGNEAEYEGPGNEAEYEGPGNEAECGGLGMRLSVGAWE